MMRDHRSDWVIAPVTEEWHRRQSNTNSSCRCHSQRWSLFWVFYYFQQQKKTSCCEAVEMSNNTSDRPMTPVTVQSKTTAAVKQWQNRVSLFLKFIPGLVLVQLWQREKASISHQTSHIIWRLIPPDTGSASCCLAARKRPVPNSTGLASPSWSTDFTHQHCFSHSSSSLNDDITHMTAHKTALACSPTSVWNSFMDHMARRCLWIL